jgi:hypothetical protein
MVYLDLVTNSYGSGRNGGESGFMNSHEPALPAAESWVVEKTSAKATEVAKDRMRSTDVLRPNVLRANANWMFLGLSPR